MHLGSLLTPIYAAAAKLPSIVPTGTPNSTLASFAATLADLTDEDAWEYTDHTLKMQSATTDHPYMSLSF